MDKIKNLVEEFSRRDEVESIALGGSRATKQNYEKSDYDVYIYLKRELDVKVREGILKKYCNYREINNQYWETEDDCILKDGIVIEIIYRKIEDLKYQMKQVVDEAIASNGYTTCMWGNLLNCIVLYDQDNRLSELKKQYSVPYPLKLRQNIIEKNMKLLDGYIPSYSAQIEKAIETGDIISVNHRSTEFLASYFDILFAYNNITHPGEKKLIMYCKLQCDQLPEKFKENLEVLLFNMFEKEIFLKTLRDIIACLKQLIEK